MSWLILRHELRRLYGTPLAWTLLAVAQFILAWAFLTELEAFQALQSRLAALDSAPGLTDLVLAPSLQNAATLALLITPLLAMRLLADGRGDGRLDFLLASPARSRQILLGKFLALLGVLAPLWLFSALMPLSLLAGGAPDLGQLGAGLLGLALTLALYAAASLWCQGLLRQPVAAVVLSYALLLFLWFAKGQTDFSLLDQLSLRRHSQNLGRGWVDSRDIGYFLLLGLWFLGMAWLRLYRRRNPAGAKARLIFTLLLTSCLWLSGWLAGHHPIAADWSRNARASLSPAGQSLVQRLQQPLHITAFAAEGSLRRGALERLLERYQRTSEQVRVRFVDPAAQPALARSLGVGNDGELLLEYAGRQLRVPQVNETEINRAIAQLDSHRQRWVLLLQGHGERPLAGLQDLLRQRGRLVRDYSLSTQGRLPDNAGLLLIAGGDGDWLSGEIEQVQAFLAQGGRLLWLLEPDSLASLHPLAHSLGLQLLPGTLVDARAAALGLDSPGFAVVTRYPADAPIRQLQKLTLFPTAAALEVQPPPGWQAHALLQTGAQSWNETGPLRGELSRDPVMLERAGPLTLGWLLEQEDDGARAALVGDVDFADDARLGSGDNLTLALALVDWLLTDEAGVAAPPRPAPDRQIELDETAAALIGFGFLLALPLGLLIAGLWIPRRRRRRA